LFGQVLVERFVCLVHQRARAGELLERCQSPDVVYVRMRRHQRAHREPVAPERFEDVVSIIARIDDDGLATVLIADDDAVALQRADREVFKDQVKATVLCGATADPSRMRGGPFPRRRQTPHHTQAMRLNYPDD